MKLLRKLEKFYWSPKPPESYVNSEGNGYGKIAHNCYGTFNLIWAINPLVTKDDHFTAIVQSTTLKKLLQQEVDGATLADRITLSTPSELGIWLEGHGDDVSPLAKSAMLKALNALKYEQPA